MTALHEGRLSPDTATPRRLLVVEDDPSIAELIALWFESSGWHVAVARSGPEGVARGATFQPDAVVLDGMLPGYNGLEVLRRLRVTSPSLPIVLSTAMDAEEDRRAAFAAGADAYLVKPWSLHALQEAVDALAARRHR